MILYILIFFTVVVLADIIKNAKWQRIVFAICMIGLAAFVGISDMLGGYDRYIYGEVFDGAADTISVGGELLTTELFQMYGKEFGYCTWNFLIGVFTSNRYVYILITTFLMYFFFWRAIKNYTENPLFALIFFMALTFFFSFTYLRQMLGVAFAWQSLKYIEKRNLKMFCLWMFLAFSFHNSAIIFFPMYFIPFKKMRKDYVILLIFTCFVIGLTGLPSALFETYGDVADAKRVEGAKYAVEIGYRWAYLAEAFFFYFFINRYYKQLGNTPMSILGLNISIVFCCILLFFARSENGGRLGWYYMIGLISLMTSIFSGKIRLAKPWFIIVVCFMLYLRILYSWGILLYPYKTFFTDGIREGDFIEEKYEYDHKYDENKFYR